jgi:hypothetical protein
MENSLDEEVGQKRKRGRPLNSAMGKNKGGGRRKTPKHKAKLIANAREHNTRNMKANEAKKRRSERIFELKKTETPQFWKSYPCPERQGQNLSQDQIDTAIRLIYKMREEGQPEVMERASNYLDISDKTLYILWRSYLKTGVVPHSLRGQKRKVRMKLVSIEWVRPIQEEMEYGSAEFVSEHLIKDALEFEVKYKTEGYIGDVVPRSWDDYILSEDAELFEDFDDGVNVDIDEEDAGVEDGFAMANVE